MTKKNFNIVIDATNMTKSIREPLIEIAKKQNYRIIAYILPKLSKRESVKRRLASNHGDISKKVWNEVWTMFDKMYELPIEDEGFDQICHKLK